MRFKHWLEMTDAWWSAFGDMARTYDPNQPMDIYGHLTSRDTEQNLGTQWQKVKKHNMDYAYLIQDVGKKLSAKGYKVTNSGWFHVEMPYDQKYTANYGGEANVDALKTYRTFVPSPENRISNFLNSLVGFADVLKNIQEADPNNPDRMQFKVPPTLKMLVSHPDSLVVHWRNVRNRQRVEQAIDQYFSQAGVQWSDRGGRATAGFDFTGSQEQGGGSHSQLIAAAMRKLFSSTPQRSQLDPQQAQDWARQWLAYFNKMNPAQLQQYISS